MQNFQKEKDHRMQGKCSKSIIFPYTSDKYMGTDTKNTSFTIAF